MMWQKLDTTVGAEVEAWQNTRTGEVLAIEECAGIGGPSYQVVTHRKKWVDDDHEIDYVGTTRTMAEAEAMAEDYR